MTEFQSRCIEKCRAFLRDELKLVDGGFEEVAGSHEAYYKFDLRYSNHRFEIYIYSDEAGFMVDGRDWIVCERPSDSTDAALIDSFMGKLNTQIMASSVGKKQ